VVILQKRSLLDIHVQMQATPKFNKQNHQTKRITSKECFGIKCSNKFKSNKKC
jgi:hypothetical protein